jgi:hypothetical protein
MTNEFETIEINISDEDKILLIQQFVKERLSKSAQFTFIEECKQVSVDEALFIAVINEIESEKTNN